MQDFELADRQQTGLYTSITILYLF